MARVTSKLQVTIPTRIAEAYGIEPGDERSCTSVAALVDMNVLVYR
jgi:bifunctional DNA-binding transcriptional regulator/antitoxin component of YhaV-PrlF toxin-antitoxin module